MTGIRGMAESNREYFTYPSSAAQAPLHTVHTDRDSSHNQDKMFHASFGQLGNGTYINQHFTGRKQAADLSAASYVLQQKAGKLPDARQESKTEELQDTRQIREPVELSVEKQKEQPEKMPDENQDELPKRSSAAYYRGIPLEIWALTDPKHMDKETGFSWYIRNDRYAYMIGEEAERFKELCRRLGVRPEDKFAELTGNLKEDNEKETIENEKTFTEEKERAETQSDIIVTSDGTRVLILTIKIGATECVTSIELSKPGERQILQASEDVINETEEASMQPALKV